MKVLVACPANMLKTSHIEEALKSSRIEPTSLLVSRVPRGSTDSWLREWARSKGVPIQDYDTAESALKALKSVEDSALLAILAPDHHETLELVTRAESKRIPVFIYRELYRQDPRINCRFSPVDRPDVWLRALTAEQHDFFRRLHKLCEQYQVEFQSGPGGDGSLMKFSDGTKFEAVEIAQESCRVRPQGAFRYRKIVVKEDER